ncbi:hypothetical protein HDU97_010414 [Phlyctochytrium planicorne]|nr:hypothetical protein HDU97_010414 [Phlyctochytrium planicorne]
MPTAASALLVSVFQKSKTPEHLTTSKHINSTQGNGFVSPSPSIQSKPALFQNPSRGRLVGLRLGDPPSESFVIDISEKETIETLRQRCFEFIIPPEGNFFNVHHHIHIYRIDVPNLSIEDWRLQEHHHFIKELRDRSIRPRNYEPSDVTRIIPSTWISTTTQQIKQFFPNINATESHFEPLRFIITVDEFPDETLANSTLINASYGSSTPAPSFMQKGGYTSLSGKPPKGSFSKKFQSYFSRSNPKRNRNIGILVVVVAILFIVIAGGIGTGLYFGFFKKNDNGSSSTNNSGNGSSGAVMPAPSATSGALKNLAKPTATLKKPTKTKSKSSSATPTESSDGSDGSSGSGNGGDQPGETPDSSSPDTPQPSGDGEKKEEPRPEGGAEGDNKKEEGGQQSEGDSSQSTDHQSASLQGGDKGGDSESVDKTEKGDNTNADATETTEGPNNDDKSEIQSEGDADTSEYLESSDPDPDSDTNTHSDTTTHSDSRSRTHHSTSDENTNTHSHSSSDTTVGTTQQLLEQQKTMNEVLKKLGVDMKNLATYLQKLREKAMVKPQRRR